MELHGTYLRAFISARHGVDYMFETAGMSNRALAAAALGIHDALKGEHPASATTVASTVNMMCAEAKPCA